MKKFIGIALSLGMIGLVTGCSVSSRHVIHGVVADVDSNPVPGAIVTSVPPTASVSTDKDGRYMIKAVKEDEYSLSANKMGYVSRPAKINASGPDFIQADIQLIPEDMIPATTQVYAEPAAADVTTVAPAAPAEAVNEAVEDTEKSSKAWWEKK